MCAKKHAHTRTKQTARLAAQLGVRCNKNNEMKRHTLIILSLSALPSYAYASGEMTIYNKLILLLFLLLVIASIAITALGAIKHPKPVNLYKITNIFICLLLIISYIVLNIMGFSTNMFIHLFVALLCLAQLALLLKSIRHENT